MRYTTVIDISEFSDVYSNPRAVLLYYHLCVKSSYVDDDRDLYHSSLRRLSSEMGFTLSACRHALRLLARHSLVTFPEPGVIKVLKFVETLHVTKRKTRKVVASDDNYVQRLEEQKKQDAMLQRRRADVKEGRTGPLALLQHLESKAEAGDIKAKKEALALRQELHRNGVL